MLGGGPPPFPKSHRMYRIWLASENARKTQEEREEMQRDRTIKRAEEEIFPYKKGPRPSMVPQWEGSQASSNAATINPESVASVTSAGSTITYYMERDQVAKLSMAAECPDPVPLKNGGNTCFANAGIDKE